MSGAMRGDQSLERFRAHKRRVTRQNDSKFRSAQRATRDLQRMPGSALRLLQNSLRAKGLDHRRDLLRLVPHDDHGLLRAQWRARADNMLDERAPPRAVQDLCKAG